MRTIRDVSSPLEINDSLGQFVGDIEIPKQFLADKPVPLAFCDMVQWVHFIDDRYILPFLGGKTCARYPTAQVPGDRSIYSEAFSDLVSLLLIQQTVSIHRILMECDVVVCSGIHLQDHFSGRLFALVRIVTGIPK